MLKIPLRKRKCESVAKVFCDGHLDSFIECLKDAKQALSEKGCEKFEILLSGEGGSRFVAVRGTAWLSDDEREKRGIK